MKIGKRLLQVGAGLIASVAISSPATAATLITGAATGIISHTSDPGLVISATPLPFPSFSLHPGESLEVDVLTIGTREGTINLLEDMAVYPISVGFDFSTPAGSSSSVLEGMTFGMIIPFTACGLLYGGCGHVAWSSPSIVHFGNGGQFSLALSDATFRTPGSATVSGRFTLISDSAPAVPEPSTWAMMILGFGFIGGAMRSARRRQDTAVSYT